MGLTAGVLKQPPKAWLTKSRWISAGGSLYFEKRKNSIHGSE
jgi:hypothetical protein